MVTDCYLLSANFGPFRCNGITLRNGDAHHDEENVAFLGSAYISSPQTAQTSLEEDSSEDDEHDFVDLHPNNLEAPITSSGRERFHSDRRGKYTYIGQHDARRRCLTRRGRTPILMKLT